MNKIGFREVWPLFKAVQQLGNVGIFLNLVHLVPGPMVFNLPSIMLSRKPTTLSPCFRIFQSHTYVLLQFTESEAELFLLHQIIQIIVLTLSFALHVLLHEGKKKKKTSVVYRPNIMTLFVLASVGLPCMPFALNTLHFLSPLVFLQRMVLGTLK